MPADDAPLLPGGGVAELCCAAATTMLALALALLWRQQQMMRRLLAERPAAAKQEEAPPPPATADSISYQVAPGAVPRSVASRLRQTISVQDFGAIPDGKTDATAAIQAAVDLHKVRPGGVEVVFPAGSYLITKPINVVNLAGGGVTLRGELSTYPALGGGSGAILIGATGGAVIGIAQP